MDAKKYLLSFSLVVSAIVSTYFVTVSTTAQQTSQKQTISADNEFQVGGILYMQKAAEYRALCFQAFNVAQWSLDADEKTKKQLLKTERKKPRAVVVDIDETILDNSPAQAVQVKNRLPFVQETWTNWVLMRKAKAIPGAVDFLKYADRKGAKIFYISNRIQVEKEATMENLKALGFPQVTDESMMIKTTESSKDARRKLIEKTYRIAILVGDSLDDLSTDFEKKQIPERFAETEKSREMFGKKYIVLPNAMYGAWENAIYGYERLNESQKSEKRREALEGY
jgi:5'-nucleotidase (lipoprotein e(P4) family)